jgi:hypothetical protein
MMRRVVFVLLFLLPALVSAQAVYKTVGPDGKVTFSDEPPAEGKATALEGYRPPVAKTPEKTSADRAAEVRQQALERHQAKRALPAATTAAAPAPDPALGQAIIGVLVFEGMVQQTEKLCISTLPTSFKRYGAAAEGWRQRNATILQQARTLMAQVLSVEERQMLEKTVAAKNTEQMAEVVRAPAAARIKWCDRSAREISEGAVDPQKRQAWVNALQKTLAAR